MEVATLLGEHNKRNLLEIYIFCYIHDAAIYIFREKGDNFYDNFN